MKEHYEEERRRKQNVEQLDYSPSSGPIGSEQKPYDESAPTMHDGRAKTRTKFYANEVDNDHIDYEKLAKINDGLFASDDNKRSYAAGRRIDADIFTDYVGFDWKQKDAVERILNDVGNVSAYQSGETLLLAIMTIVANRDDILIRSINEHVAGNEHDKSIHKMKENFRELREICHVKPRSINQARKKLRENVL